MNVILSDSELKQMFANITKFIKQFNKTILVIIITFSSEFSMKSLNLW